MASDTDSKVIVYMLLDNTGLTKGLKESEKIIDKSTGNSSKSFDGLSQAGATAASFVGNVMANAFIKIASAVTRSIGDAVSRLDTLNNAAKVFSYMGFSAGDVAVSMEALKESILGLPTPLNDAVSGMQLIAAQNGDIQKAQKLYSALNNAVLGFGGTSSMASNAILQLSQDLGRGYIAGSTMNSLLNANMGPALAAIAKKFGTTSGALKEALGGFGQLSDVGIRYAGDKVQWFTDQLIELDQNGGGGLASLQSIAKAATNGIGSSFDNMKTAVSRGLATIMDSIGAANIASAIKNIGSAFENTLKAVSGVIGFIKENASVFSALAVAVAVGVTTMAAFNMVMKVYTKYSKLAAAATSYMKAVTTLSSQGNNIAASSWKALNTAMKANVIGIVITAVAALVAGFIYLWNNVEGFRNFFIGIWNSIVSVAKTAATSVLSFFGAIPAAVDGAIKNVTAGINSVINRFIEFGKAVKQWFSNAFIAALSAVESAWNATVTFFTGVFNTIAGFIDEHKTLLVSIGIVISTILAPKIISIGISWAAAAASAVAAFAVMAAGAVKNAAVTSWEWIKSAVASAKAFIQGTSSVIGEFIKTSLAAAKNAAVVTIQWVKSAAQSAAAFIKNIPSIIKQFVLASASAISNAAITMGSWIASAAQSAAAWLAGIAKIIAGFVMTGVQALIAGAKMMAAWMMALGPIGILIAAITGIAALFVWLWTQVDGFRNFFIGAFQSISNFISSVVTWIGEHWQLLLALLGGPIGLIVGLVISNFNTIKNFISGVVNSIIGFFTSMPRSIKGVVDTIVGFFSGIGKTIGDFIAGGFKAIINGALKLAEDFLNGPINLINGAIDTINKIPGVNIGKISNIRLPRMAKGYLATSPTVGIFGEAGKEAVMPLERNTGWISDLAKDIQERGGTGGGGNTINQTNNNYTEYDVDVANRDLARMMRRATA